MATTTTLSDGRICVIRTKDDTAESLIAAMREHADHHDDSGETRYLSWILLSPFDPEMVGYVSETSGVTLQFLEEENPDCPSDVESP